MSNKEQFFGPTLRGPVLTKAQSASNQFAGRTTLASGSATVTVSTTSVKSDSIIFHALQAATVSSGAICVRSINPGVAFSFGWTDGGARAFDSTIMWRIELTS